MNQIREVEFTRIHQTTGNAACSGGEQYFDPAANGPAFAMRASDTEDRCTSLTLPLIFRLTQAHYKNITYWGRLHGGTEFV